MTRDEDVTDETIDRTGAPGTAVESPFVIDAGPVADDLSEILEVETLETEFKNALDLDKWTSGERMDQLAARLEKEVEQAAHFEDDMAPRVLAALERGLPGAADASRESGVYPPLTPEIITKALSNVVFNGLTEGCDGTRVTVSTLPVTVVQIGVCLTTYQGTGDGGSIGHRLYRHDIFRKNGNVEDEVLEFLSRRARQKRSDAAGEFGDDGNTVAMSDMMCRALMIYAERAMLADRSHKPWRMGHGGPMPHELIVGSGRKEMAFASLDMLRRLLLGHQKFIFVPSEINDQAVVTIANSLQPLQYAVLRNTKDIIEGYVTNSSYERPHYKKSGLYDAVRDFQTDVCSKVVLGVYRASALAPGRIFYAHEDHVHDAAQIVMADSALQEARGFPNLIDIADRTCRGMFEPGGLSAQVHAALARTGSPFRFLSERGTRA